MSSFSLARVPYYICVAIFCGLTALVCFWNNATAVGVISDLYLAAMIVSGCLAGASVLFMVIAKAGDDDEAGLEVAGVPIGKQAYYVGVLVIALWRIIAGYQMNHLYTGIHAVYGVLWLLAGIGVAIFTYANYKSLYARTASKPLGKTSPRY